MSCFVFDMLTYTELAVVKPLSVDLSTQADAKREKPPVAQSCKCYEYI